MCGGEYECVCGCVCMCVCTCVCVCVVCVLYVRGKGRRILVSCCHELYSRTIAMETRDSHL